MSQRLSSVLGRLGRDERGTTLVELALSVALFLLLFFALLEFGRMSYNYVTAEKALQIAARMAVVRPPVCAGVPTGNERGSNTAPRYGERCNAAVGNVCAAPDPVTCTGLDPAAGTPGLTTSTEIWDRIEALMPNGASRANLRYTYAYQPELNFLGGPFVPMVTVDLVDLDFQFLGILSGLARVAGATDTTGMADLEDDGVTFGLSVSLPGEDLALGIN